MQRRLFTDRGDGAAAGDDIVEVRLFTLRVRQPRRFGDCWAATRLWRMLGLDDFWRERLGGQRGGVAWEKVLELLYANRLPDPRSELLLRRMRVPATFMVPLQQGQRSESSPPAFAEATAGTPDLQDEIAPEGAQGAGAFGLRRRELLGNCFYGPSSLPPPAGLGWRGLARAAGYSDVSLVWGAFHVWAIDDLKQNYLLVAPSYYVKEQFVPSSPLEFGDPTFEEISFTGDAPPTNSISRPWRSQLRRDILSMGWPRVAGYSALAIIFFMAPNPSRLRVKLRGPRSLDEL